MNNLFRILFAALLLLGFSFAVDVNSCRTITDSGTYNLIADISSSSGDCLVIDADYAFVFCDYYHISAPIDSYAVYIRPGRHHVSVNNCILENSLSGINAGYGAHDVAIIGNNAQNNRLFGFEIGQLSNSTISGNLADGNSFGFYGGGSDNTFERNIAHQNHNDGFFLGSSVGNTFRYNRAEGNLQSGFTIAYDSTNNYLLANNATGNGIGFWLRGIMGRSPSGNVITASLSSGNSYGFSATDAATSNKIMGNTITDNGVAGVFLSNSVHTSVIGNTIRNNGNEFPGHPAVSVINSSDYIVSDNYITDSVRAVDIIMSPGGSFDNNDIIGSTFALLLQDSPGSEIVSNILQDAGVVVLSGDSSGVSVSFLTMREGSNEMIVHIPSYTGNYELEMAPSPGAAPANFSFMRGYLDVYDVSGAGTMLLGLGYADSDLGTANESQVRAMAFGAEWTQPAQALEAGSNVVSVENPATATYALFMGPTPPTPPIPPVTPPSGGSSGGSSGGTTHGGGGSGAPHVGIPYVPSGSGGTTVTEVEPSCTSDSDCASSAECSGGICTALEAGSSCGSFVDHEWVDYGCCGTEDCDAGEVCKDNECVSMEPLDVTGTEPQTSGAEASGSDQGVGRLLADVPWWVLLLLVLMVGGGIYARYRMGQQPPEGEAPPEEEMPPAEPEEE